MDASHALLKELTEAFGPPGHEEEIAGLMRKHLKGLGEVSQDGLGSIICKLRAVDQAGDHGGVRDARSRRGGGLGDALCRAECGAAGEGGAGYAGRGAAAGEGWGGVGGIGAVGEVRRRPSLRRLLVARPHGLVAAFA